MPRFYCEDRISGAITIRHGKLANIVKIVPGNTAIYNENNDKVAVVDYFGKVYFLKQEEKK